MTNEQAALIAAAVLHSDLRTRIAAALQQADKEPQPFDKGVGYEYLADAVIDELGLRLEWGALDEDEGGCLFDCRDEVKVFPGDTVKQRLITEWVDE